jgi:hypothetical protein
MPFAAALCPALAEIPVAASPSLADGYKLASAIYGSGLRLSPTPLTASENTEPQTPRE